MAFSIVTLHYWQVLTQNCREGQAHCAQELQKVEKLRSPNRVEAVRQSTKLKPAASVGPLLNNCVTPHGESWTCSPAPGWTPLCTSHTPPAGVQYHSKSLNVQRICMLPDWLSYTQRTWIRRNQYLAYLYPLGNDYWALCCNHSCLTCTKC